MGNSQSIIDERDKLAKQLSEMQTRIIEYEMKIKQLESDNFDMKKELHKYEKTELFTKRPRIENDDDVL